MSDQVEAVSEQVEGTNTNQDSLSRNGTSSNEPPLAEDRPAPSTSTSTAQQRLPGTAVASRPAKRKLSRASNGQFSPSVPSRGTPHFSDAALTLLANLPAPATSDSSLALTLQPAASGSETPDSSSSANPAASQSLSRESTPPSMISGDVLTDPQLLVATQALSPGTDDSPGQILPSSAPAAADNAPQLVAPPQPSIATQQNPHRVPYRPIGKERYTAAQDAIICQLLNEGKLHKEIGESLSRSTSSINARVQKLREKGKSSSKPSFQRLRLNSPLVKVYFHR